MKTMDSIEHFDSSANSCCSFQNEIGLSFRKLKSYKYHLHDYVKFDRNRINLYPFLLHVIVTLTLDILCRSSQEKPIFFIFLLMLSLSLNPHKKPNRTIKLSSYIKEYLYLVTHKNSDILYFI